MRNEKLLLTLFALMIGHFCFGQGNSDDKARMQSQPSISSQNSPQSGDKGKESMTLPYLSIKSNLLYDATASMNLGIEFRTGKKTSFEIPISYNPWTFRDNAKWRHILAQPEFRLWTNETFDGHFFGLHGHYAYYNVGGLYHPPFSEYMKAHRFQGWLAGAGLSYGYRWNFNHRWGMEATVGLGYAFLSYDKFECAGCGKQIGSETKNYFGPTKAGLTLIYSIGGSGKSKKSYTLVTPAKQSPKLTVGFITPEVEAVKARSSEVGKAYLDFVVARSEILPNFRNNASELRRIQELIRQIVNDPDATITSITITGYASPEGSFSSNMTLSQRRATSFKDYIKSMYDIRENTFAVTGVGEDWATLESLVSQSNMPDKYRIIDIIRSSEPHDTRENRLKDISGGRPYRQMMAEMYPKLRRMECQVHYTVVPFTVEQGKEIYRTKPNNLSLNEMYLIAQTYPAGSSEYKEIFETAARLFPQSDVANLNAAASALSRKDVDSAARYLNRVKEQNVQYWNNFGVLMWLKGDRRMAMECFAKGGAQGAANITAVNNYNK